MAESLKASCVRCGLVVPWSRNDKDARPIRCECGGDMVPSRLKRVRFDGIAGYFLSECVNGLSWEWSSVKDIHELRDRSQKVCDAGTEDWRDYEILQLADELLVMLARDRFGASDVDCGRCPLRVGDECPLVGLKVEDHGHLLRCPVCMPPPREWPE